MTYYTLQTTTRHSKGKTVTRKCVGTMTPQQLNAYVLLPTEKLIARTY